MRHFRGRTELPYLAEEQNYDFNFQDFQRFDEKRVILPGDQITVECTYNTESLERPMFVRKIVRKHVTRPSANPSSIILGRTVNERRNVYGLPRLLSTYEGRPHLSQWTYPADRNETIECIESEQVNCHSGETIPFHYAANLLILYSIDENDMNPVIVLPQEYANERLSEYVLESNWSFSNLSDDELTYLIRYAPQKSQCFWRKIEGIEGMEEVSQLTSYPQIDKPYTKPKLKCQRLANTELYTQNASSLLFVNGTILIFTLFLSILNIIL